MRVIKQGTAPVIVFLMVLATDHVTGATGLTVTAKISKNGGAGATATNAVTAVDATNLPGWYQVALTAAETGTVGDLILRATATGADQADRLLDVESGSISSLDYNVLVQTALIGGLPGGIDTTLSAAHGSGSWLSGTSTGGATSVAGSGALVTTVTVNDNLGAPLDGVQCWITSDAAGAYPVAGTLVTDTWGHAVFFLDPGTFYLWRQRSGINFVNPELITVTVA
jgi:hypothetical protein